MGDAGVFASQHHSCAEGWMYRMIGEGRRPLPMPCRIANPRNSGTGVRYWLESLYRLQNKGKPFRYSAVHCHFHPE
jgi:hypothetical protein